MSVREQREVVGYRVRDATGVYVKVFTFSAVSTPSKARHKAYWKATFGPRSEALTFDATRVDSRDAAHAIAAMIGGSKVMKVMSRRPA